MHLVVGTTFHYDLLQVLGQDMTLEIAFIFMTTTGRILVGGIMLVAGAAKLKAGSQQFSRAILGYGLVSPVIATLLGRALPRVEIATGICLMIGLFNTIASLVAFALLSLFSAALMLSLYRGRAHDCGCFGLAKTKQVQWWMVYRNLALMAFC